MSYAVSCALQQAVFAALTSDAVLSTLVEGAVYDAVPSGSVPDLYVSLGPETVRELGDVTSSGTEHRFVVTVATEAPSFARAKEVAGQVSDVLHNAALTLTRGHLVSLQFMTARAAKIDNATGRKIDLTFRARVEDS